MFAFSFSYRGLAFASKDPFANNAAASRFNPLVEMLFKEQEYLLKRAALYKNVIRFPLSTASSTTTTTTSTSDSSNQHKPVRESMTLNDLVKTRRKSLLLKPQHITSPDIANKTNENTVQVLKIASPDEDLPDDDEELSVAAAKIPLDEILNKRGGSYFKESFRYNPINSCTETTSSISNKEKSSSSSTSSSPSPMLKALPESSLLQDCSSIEEETRCVVCNANFPSVWLLEQHAALQHANLGPMEEKPFICEQCGQSYRYRSAYVKHKEQNHRARLPADKLFTCDVCGMQFRYLKSFKKHRLNHALERLHGKFERRVAQLTANSGDNNNEMVSSSNEALNEEIAELQFAIKSEEDEEDQDDTIDSPNSGLNTLADNCKSKDSIRGSPLETSSSINITSSEMNTVSSPILREENNFMLKVGFLLMRIILL